MQLAQHGRTGAPARFQRGAQARRAGADDHHVIRVVVAVQLHQEEASRSRQSPSVGSNVKITSVPSATTSTAELYSSIFSQKRVRGRSA